MQAELNTDRGDMKGKVRERHGGIQGQEGGRVQERHRSVGQKKGKVRETDAGTAGISDG